ncbi:hypothetical protein FQA39_LY16316 [Lamprigera yunnana]|nr:hypothetical protein FQA39_LY16316 [Lamprigera yunnana]
MVVLNTYTIIGLIKRPKLEWEFTMVMTDIAASYLTQVNMACAILFGCVNAKGVRILAVLTSINEFDKNIQKAHPSINILCKYRKSKCFLILGMIGTFILLTVVIVLSLLAAMPLIHFGEFLAYIAPETISSSVLFQFCTILLSLRQRFSWLNEIILSLSKELKDNDKIKMYDQIRHHRQLSEDSIVMTLEKIRLNHYVLCNISKNLNAAYSIQLLLIVAQIFIIIIILTYYSGRRFILDVEIPVDYILYCFSQIGLALLQVTILTGICSTTCREVRKWN